MTDKKNSSDTATAFSGTPLEIGEKDLLNMDEYHESVFNFIKGADTPIIITLQGEWGSGKSSLMNIIKDKIAKDSKFYSISVNTWQCSLLDSPSLAVVRILQSMTNQLIQLKPDNDQRDRIDEIINKIAIAASGAKSIYDIVGGPLLNNIGVSNVITSGIGKAINEISGIANNNNHKKTGRDQKQKLYDNASLVGQLHSEIKDLVNDILELNQSEQTVQKIQAEDEKDREYHIKPYSPLEASDFASCFDKAIIFIYSIIYNLICSTLLLFANFIVIIIDHIFKMVWDVLSIIIEAVRSYLLYTVKEFCYIFLGKINKNKLSKKPTKISNINNKEKIIFFVDDLDRLSSEMALQILEILNNVFNIKHCIFIVALDPTILIEALENKLGKLTPEDPFKHQRYLEKLIQNNIAIPVSFYDIAPLLKAKLQKISFFTKDELNSSELLDLLRNIVELSVGKNPRLIINMLNILSFSFTSMCILWKRYVPNIEPDQIDVFDRKLVFILLCVSITYPYVFLTMTKFPYFRDWNREISIALFAPHISQITDEMLELQKLLNNIDLKDRTEHAEWEIVLLGICQYNNFYITNFPRILKILKTVDDLFMKESNMNEDRYKKTITRFFNFVNGHTLSEDIPLDEE